MGQKVNPIGLRVGINRTWDSRWYANKREYGPLLHEDIRIRRFLQKRLTAREKGPGDHFDGPPRPGYRQKGRRY